MPFVSSFRISLEMIKFEHTVFALPFTLLSVFLASVGWPAVPKLLWILLAMVGARSAAMAFNRIADRQLDAENPRTRMRALPVGKVSLGFASVFTLVSSLVFVLAAHQLNPLCFGLSVPVLVILFAYSYTKRFTHFSHLVLGLCLGMAPVGAWIAMRGDIRLTPLLLGLVVLLWTAGFDIIYACQDLDFDHRRNLFSLPNRFGIHKALRISSGLHALMLLLLLLLVLLENLSWISLSGVGLAACLIWYEHHLVHPEDLSKVNQAFFTVNGYISILLFLVVGLDKILHQVARKG